MANKLQEFNLYNGTPHSINFVDFTGHQNTLPVASDHEPPRAHITSGHIGEVTVADAAYSQFTDLPMYELDFEGLENPAGLQRWCHELREQGQGNKSLIVVSAIAAYAARLSGIDINPSTTDVALGYPADIQRKFTTGAITGAGRVDIPTPALPGRPISPDVANLRRIALNTPVQLANHTPEEIRLKTRSERDYAVPSRNTIAEPQYHLKEIGRGRINGKPSDVPVNLSAIESVKDTPDNMLGTTLRLVHTKAYLAYVRYARAQDFARLAFPYSGERGPGGQQQQTFGAVAVFSAATLDRLNAAGF